MNVAIVKYNAGNIYSVANALKRLGITPELTDDDFRKTHGKRIVVARREGLSQRSGGEHCQNGHEACRDLRKMHGVVGIGSAILTI